jgi:hypothetical protein
VSEFFLRRPVFASVCSVVILLLGLVSIPTLPIAQFPAITPPAVTVTVVYNGASADILRLVRLVHREHGIDLSSRVAAHVHGSSCSAYVGGPSARSHDVTELDHTMLSAIADFASLALGVCRTFEGPMV